MIYDTSINNRDKWINEIKKHTGEKDTANVIQFALSFTLQACRTGDVNKYKWKDDCKKNIDIFNDNEKKIRYKNIIDAFNELLDENAILKEIIIQGDNVHGENERLKQHIKELEKQCYLIHMSTMFSTVKSFQGDVSKRYYYSEATNNIYDTANTYGSYDKILDYKEIAMLLNEYNTLYEELMKENKKLSEDKEAYQMLWEQMSYYFEDGTELKDLDHKDFKVLQRLAKGLVD